MEMERHRVTTAELEANLEALVAWVQEGQGHRLIEIEGDNGERAFMASPALITWMEERIAQLSQGLT